MDYLVGQLPANTPPEIARELRAIAEAMNSKHAFLLLEKQYKPPKKFGDGTIVLADGVQWNPGSGPGYYGYRDGSWKFLG